MRIAITGASGFLGNHVYEILIKNGANINKLVHNNLGKNTGTETRIIKGDILNKSSLLTLVEDVDVVIHLAAALSLGEKKAASVHEINITGTKNIIEACKQKKIKKLIHVSSIKTLQHNSSTHIVDESTPLIQNSSSAYDFSKAIAEKLILEASHEGLDAVILNPTAVIGPGDSQPSYLGKAMIHLYKNNLPLLIAGGYNFVDVRDVAWAVFQSVTHGRKGERYILSGQWISLLELATKIARFSDKKTAPLIVPLSLARIGLPFAALAAKLTGNEPLYTSESLNNIRSSNKNISNLKARNELGFTCTPIEKTLADTFEWFIKYKMLIK